VRATINPDYHHPEAETARLKTLQVTLPYFIKQYEEERTACNEMKSFNPREPFVINWDKELAEWQELIRVALEFGTERELWHKMNALCTRCREPLVRVERSICDACKRGKILPPE